MELWDAGHGTPREQGVPVIPAWGKALRSCFTNVAASPWAVVVAGVLDRLQTGRAGFDLGDALWMSCGRISMSHCLFQVQTAAGVR